MKTIVRLVSCVAIMVLAGSEAEASPSYSSEYTVSGTTVTGAGTNTTTAFFQDTGDQTNYTITINGGANLGNSTQSEIYLYGGSVTNSGTLASTAGTVYFAGQAITGASGSVINNTEATISGSGSDAILFYGNGSVANAGTIVSDNSAIYQAANLAGNLTSSNLNFNLSNSGQINGGETGVDLEGNTINVSGASSNNITDNLANSGTIYGGNYGVYLYEYNEGNTASTDSISFSLTNSGSISSGGQGIEVYYLGNYENTAVTGTQSVSLNINNNAGGTIFGTSVGIEIDYIQNYDLPVSAAAQIAINNAGTLSAQNGPAIYFANSNKNEGNVTGTSGWMVTLNNQKGATIASPYGALYAYELLNTGNSTSNVISFNVNNAGQITATGYQSLYFYELYNESNTGGAGTANTFNISVNNQSSGLISSNGDAFDLESSGNYKNTGTGANNITFNFANAGQIFSTTGAGIDLDGLYNYKNTSSTANTINLAVSNSGIIQSTNDGAYIYAYNFQNSGSNAETFTFTNSGAINSSSAAALESYLYNYNDINPTSEINTVNVANSGLMIGGVNGVYLNTYNDGGTTALAVNNLTFTNTGLIQGKSANGVYLYNENTDTATQSMNTISFTNLGTIIGGGANGAFLENKDTNTSGTALNTISFTNYSNGSITGATNGVAIVQALTATPTAADAVSVTNYGSITGGTYGINMGASFANILSAGGSISGATDAILLQGTNSNVTILGRTNVTGTMEGSGNANNTLNFKLAGMSPAQITAAQNAINAAAGGPGNFTTGGLTYYFDGFSGVNLQAVSFENSVDPGLKDLGTKLDNTTIPLPASMDAVYTQGFYNPEAVLNNLSGREFLDAFTQIGLSNATQFGASADSRANSLRSGSSGMDFSGLSLSPNTMIASLGNMQTALNRMGSSAFGGTEMSDSVDHKSMLSPLSPMEAPLWGIWAAGTVTFADETGTGTAPGYNSVSGSPTFGVDYRVCPDVVIGTLFNYTNGDVNFADGSTLNTDTYLGGLYVDWAHKGFFVNGLAAGGETNYNQERNTLSGATAHGAPSGSEEVATVSGGYDFKVTGMIVISPEAGVQYTHLNKNAFSETGAGTFDLNVGDQDVDSLRTKLGANISFPFNCGGTKIVPEINGFWYHECLDNSNGVTNSLPGAPGVGSFVVQTNPEGRDFALVGAGVTATPNGFHGCLSFFLNYSAQVGQSNFLAQTVDGGLRIGF